MGAFLKTALTLSTLSTSPQVRIKKTAAAPGVDHVIV
jgi:hypothetical protein